MFTLPETTQDILFQALAHQVRRKILDLLTERPGLTVGELAKGFDVSRIAVMNHLQTLTNADLVISEKSGRSRKLFVNLIPIQMIYDRWSDQYSQYWSSRITAIKYAAEQRHVETGANDGE